jgi:hypothetical protein
MLPASDLKSAFINVADSFDTLVSLQRLIDLLPLDADYASLTEKQYLDICVLIISYQQLSRIEINKLAAHLENAGLFVFHGDKVVLD